MSSAWIDIGGADAVGGSLPLSAEVDGVPVIVVRCGTELYAVEDRCTHDGESLAGAEVEDCQVVCPRHGSHFCLRTGEALTPPAYEPLRTYRERAGHAGAGAAHRPAHRAPAHHRSQSGRIGAGAAADAEGGSTGSRRGCGVLDRLQRPAVVRHRPGRGHRRAVRKTPIALVWTAVADTRVAADPK